jgi:hypothetical protein
MLMIRVDDYNGHSEKTNYLLRRSSTTVESTVAVGSLDAVAVLELHQHLLLSIQDDDQNDANVLLQYWLH